SEGAHNYRWSNSVFYFIFTRNKQRAVRRNRIVELSRGPDSDYAEAGRQPESSGELPQPVKGEGVADIRSHSRPADIADAPGSHCARFRRAVPTKRARRICRTRLFGTNIRHPERPKISR